MPDWLSKETLDAWWKVLNAAPHLSLMLIAVCIGLGYVGARWRYAGRVETLEERLKLKEDTAADYKRKLDGATPDEARARMDALEARLDVMGARRLLISQRRTMVDVLKAPDDGITVQITYDRATVDGRSFATELAEAFREAGWVTSLDSVDATWRPLSGIAVRVREGQPTLEQGWAAEAFLKAGLEYEVAPGETPGEFDVAILVGPAQI